MWAVAVEKLTRSSVEVGQKIKADFREGDEDSKFSVFSVWRFNEWPEPLH